MILVRTQTNWFPKATHENQPVTPPVTPPYSPPPTASASPFPSCIPRPSCPPNQTNSVNGNCLNEIDPPVGGVYCAIVSPRPRPSVTPGSCVKAGCSNELCVDSANGPIASTCEYRPEYACYQQAACERQSNGQCGFTISDSVAQCIGSANLFGKVIIKDQSEPIFLQTDTHGSLFIGRNFVQLAFTFPSTPTIVHRNSDINVQFTINGNTVEVSPELTRASDGSTGSPEHVGVALVTKPGQTNVITLTPSSMEYFDKGYMYNFHWKYVLNGVKTDATLFSTQFATIAPSHYQSDINSDSKVDIIDYSTLSSEFLKSKIQYDADLNGDQKIDLLDYSYFVREYTEYQNNN
jgi:hypothetical protein